MNPAQALAGCGFSSSLGKQQIKNSTITKICRANDHVQLLQYAIPSPECDKGGPSALIIMYSAYFSSTFPWIKTQQKHIWHIGWNTMSALVGSQMV